MAGENLGSVYYTVEANVDTVNDAKTQVAASTASMTKNFKNVDTQVTKTSKAVKSGMTSMQQGAQNFGYQIQDISVQLSGGQSPFLVLSQQLPQMLTGMGAAAAGIGALIAITGGLLLAFSDTTTNLEKFQKAIESMQASITVGANGVAEYTEQMKVLAGISETLAKIKIATLLGEQKQAFKDGAKALQEYTSDVAGFVRGFGSLGDTIEEITGKGLGKDGFDEAASAVKDFRFAVGAFNANQTVENVDELENALNQLTAAGASSTKQGRELIERTVELITAFRSGQITAKALNEALNDTATITGEAAAQAKTYAETVKSMVEALQLETQTLGTSDRAKALHIAWLNKATQAQFDEINAAYDAIEAHDANEQKIKDLTESEKKLAAERKKNADDYNKQMFDQFLLEEKRAQAERERARKRASDVTAEVTELGSTPIEKLQADLQAKYDLIAEYEQLETANHQLAIDARAAADREYEANKMAALEQMFVQESEMNALIISSLNGLQATASNVFSGMLSQTMTAKEAVSAFANAIVNDLIGSLVNVGIQYVKNALISQSADQAMLQSQLATKTANAALHTTAVAATVTELVALGAAGAYAATAAIPYVGPALAPGASATAAAAIGAVGSAAVAAAPIAGMRLYGGYTSPNSLYQVNENGKPEMFSDGKNDFLMTGSRGGSVTSNSDLSNSQPIINITTVNNAAGVEVSTQQSTSDGQTDIKLIIDTVASNISSGGKIRSAITKSTTAKNKVV